MVLQSVISSIENYSVSEEVHKQRTSDIRLVSLMLYEDPKTLGEIDFNSFTYEELKSAFDDIIEYESDEHESDETTLLNIGNAVLEINRLAHFVKSVQSIEPIGKKRRFF
jgi:hypothetical protein